MNCFRRGVAGTEFGRAVAWDDQMQLWPGSGHGGIQILHLLVGIAAMGLGGVLAKRLTAKQTGTQLDPELMRS